MMPFDISEWPNRIRFGAGSVAELNSSIAELGATRALVVCGASVASGEILERVLAGLGAASAGVFDSVETQTPLRNVKAAVEMAREVDADAIVSVGGGSAIDAGKCVAMMLASGGDLEPFRIKYDENGSMERCLLGRGVLPHVAVPTTAGSSSEVMPTAGCLDTERRRKLLFWDAALVPKLVLLDPELAVFAPPTLTAHSGITSVARCIEALYSRERQPISTGLAVQGLRLLMRSLARAVEKPNNLEARAECQIACLMSGVAAINAMVSVIHAVGHILGGRFGLQHGAGHGILLPFAMRLLLPEIGDDQHLVLQALNGNSHSRELSADAAGAQAAAAIKSLCSRLPVSRRLRDTGVAENDISAIADAAIGDYMMPNAPRPVTRDELSAMLQSAW
jgi:alcohol dehydrogenase class IV